MRKAVENIINDVIIAFRVRNEKKEEGNKNTGIFFNKTRRSLCLSDERFVLSAGILVCSGKMCKGQNSK